MDARHAVKDAKGAGDHGAESEAHRMVDEAKRALGERGPVCWKDGAPDLNKRAVKSTHHAEHEASGFSRRMGGDAYDHSQSLDYAAAFNVSKRWRHYAVDL